MYLFCPVVKLKVQPIDVLGLRSLLHRYVLSLNSCPRTAGTKFVEETHEKVFLVFCNKDIPLSVGVEGYEDNIQLILWFLERLKYLFGINHHGLNFIGDQIQLQSGFPFFPGN